MPNPSSEHPLRVLAVDDDPALVDMIETFLEQESDRLAVETKTNATDAMAFLKEASVDCIVSDYDMPGMDGIEFLRTVRERDPTLPFILFTARGGEEVASEAISLDVTDYIRKQMGTQQYAFLARRIEQAVDQYRLETEIQRIYRAVESAQEGISLLDEDGRFTYVNAAYAAKYEYEVQELIGAHWTTVYEESQAETIEEEILPVIEDNASWHGETTGKRKDGTTFPEDHIIAKAADGGLVCTVRDISEQKARQERLEQERAFLQSAIDALDDLFYVIDTDGTAIRWNDRAREVTGYTDEEMSAMEATDFVVPDDRDAVREALGSVIETGDQKTVDVNLQTKAGDNPPYEITGSPLENEAGEIIGVCGLARRQPDHDRR